MYDYLITLGDTPEPATLQDRPFRLLDLPVEIRLKIYKFALRKKGPILLRTLPFRYDRRPQSQQFGKILRINQIRDEQDSDDTKHKTKQILLSLRSNLTALLSTCKKINQEATPILFSSNMIVVTPRIAFNPHSQWTADFAHVLRHVKRLTFWVDSTVLLYGNGLERAEAQVDTYRNVMPSLNRLTVLFSDDTWQYLQQKDEDEINRIFYLFQRAFMPDTQFSIDFGIYERLMHAFNSLKSHHRFEYH